VNARDNSNGTALIRATWHEHTRVAELLINKGIDVNAEDNMHATAWMYASRNKLSKIAKLLERHGAH
jgi:hypothetical protein